MWKVYIVRCADDSLYTGITTDLERRIKEHNESKGAKYTRARGPVELVYSAEFKDRSEATKEELRIKSLGREAKLALIK